ncbi:MAG: helix-turn-helix domain-containing protein [Dehalogenimonas sp.]
METKTTGNEQKALLTVDEVQKLLRISRGLTYQAIQRREIPSIRIGRRILIPRMALDRLLETGFAQINCKA